MSDTIGVEARRAQDTNLRLRLELLGRYNKASWHLARKVKIMRVVRRLERTYNDNEERLRTHA